MCRRSLVNPTIAGSAHRATTPSMNGNGDDYDYDKQELDKLEQVDWRRRQFPRANMVYPPIKTVFEQEMPKKCEEVYMCLALLKANKRSLGTLLQAEAKQVGII